MTAFNDHYKNLKNNPKNGETDADLLTRAMNLYSDGKKGGLYCWNVARHSSKWARLPLTGQSLSKRSKTSSSTNRSDARTEYEINLSDDDVEAERPLGRDK
ncbi:hypothetical protein Hanom_Chr08g00744971 [Helianthus anomalus]